MDTENLQPTQGSEKEGFIPVSPEVEKSTKLQKTEEVGDKFGIRYIPKLLETLEENFAFSAILLGILGYIIISAFGHMDSLSKYLGYIIFLFFSFMMYKLLAVQKIKLETNLKTLNLSLIFGLLVMLFVFAFEHGLLKFIGNFIQKIIKQ